jgi:ABC-2 type transport system permease protein
LQAASHVSPATYLLRGIRGALINGKNMSQEAGVIATLALFGAILVPASLAIFAAAERWANKTGRLKRQG